MTRTANLIFALLLPGYYLAMVTVHDPINQWLAAS